MNLYLYLLIIALSILLVFFRIKDWRIATLSLTGMITFWSVVARSTEPTADVWYYTFIMTSESPVLLFSSLISEPVLWVFHQFIYGITSDIFLTWVLGDIILLSICYYAIINLKSGLGMSANTRSIRPYYPSIFVIILISWPYYLGFYLTYRQLLAAIIFLLAVSQVRASTLKGLMLLVCAGLTHNSIFIFAPIVLYVSQRSFLRILAFFAIPLIPIVLSYAPFLLNKENQYVGAILAAMYPTTAVVLSAILTYLVKTQRVNVSKDLIFINFFIPYAIVVGWLTLPNGFSERLGLLTFSLILPILIVFIVNNFRDRSFILFFFAIFGVTPILVFYTSLISI